MKINSKTSHFMVSIRFLFVFEGEEIVMYFILVLAFHETLGERNSWSVRKS